MRIGQLNTAGLFGLFKPGGPLSSLELLEGILPVIDAQRCGLGGLELRAAIVSNTKAGAAGSTTQTLFLGFRKPARVYACTGFVYDAAGADPEFPTLVTPDDMILTLAGARAPRTSGDDAECSIGASDTAGGPAVGGAGECLLLGRQSTSPPINWQGSIAIDGHPEPTQYASSVCLKYKRVIGVGNTDKAVLAVIFSMSPVGTLPAA